VPRWDVWHWPRGLRYPTPLGDPIPTDRPDTPSVPPRSQWFLDIAVQDKPKANPLDRVCVGVCVRARPMGEGGVARSTALRWNWKLEVSGNALGRKATAPEDESVIVCRAARPPLPVALVSQPVVCVGVRVWGASPPPGRPPPPPPPSPAFMQLTRDARASLREKGIAVDDYVEAQENLIEDDAQEGGGRHPEHHPSAITRWGSDRRV